MTFLYRAIATLTAASSAAVSLGAQDLSSRWAVIGLIDDAVVSIDTTTVDRTAGGRFEVWFRADKWPRDSVRAELGRQEYSHVISRRGIDCTGGRMAVRAEVYYDTTGKVVHSTQNDEAAWRLAVPETVGEAYVRDTCKLLRTSALQRDVDLWLLPSSRGTKMIPIGDVTVSPRQNLWVHSADPQSTHVITIDTIPVFDQYSPVQLTAIRQLLLRYSNSRRLDERGDAWIVLAGSLKPGRYQFRCEMHGELLERIFVEYVDGSAATKRP